MQIKGHALASYHLPNTIIKLPPAEKNSADLRHRTSSPISNSLQFYTLTAQGISFCQTQLARLNRVSKETMTHIAYKVKSLLICWISLGVHQQVIFFPILNTGEPNGRWLAPKNKGDLTQVTAKLLS